MTADNPVSINMDVKASADFNPIISATPKGLDRLFSLVFGKREAEILRHKFLTEARTQKEYQQILTGECTFEDGHLIPLPKATSTDDLNPFQIGERQEIENFVENVKIAAQALMTIQDNDISDQEIHGDFFARWRREARVIGETDLRVLWGRILAEEIRFPGTVSYRCLDLLKNITSEEARIFQRVAPYIELSGFLVYDRTQHPLPDDISHENLVVLQECGLLSNIADVREQIITRRISVGNEQRFALLFKDIALLSCRSRIFTYALKVSSAGKILLSICDYDTPNEECVKYLFKFIRETCPEDAEILYNFKSHL